MYEANAPGAPLVEGSLGAPKGGVAAPVAGGPPVVRREHNDGVLVLASLLQRCHNLHM